MTTHTARSAQTKGGGRATLVFEVDGQVTGVVFDAGAEIPTVWDVETGVNCDSIPEWDLVDEPETD
jgi:hypothetical protein